MLKIPLCLLIVCISTSLFAQKPSWPPGAGPDNLEHLAPWGARLPSPMQRRKAIPRPPRIMKLLADQSFASAMFPRRHLPSIRLRASSSGAAVVVFPGGGYRILAIDLEGTEVCEWLNSAGITCVLLKYRRTRLRAVSEVGSRASGRPARARNCALARSRVAY